MIDDAVEWCVDAPAQLARLLPAQVDIAVAAGDFPAAEMAAGQLDAVSARLGSPAAAAASDDAAGVLALHHGDLAEAVRRFTSAVRNWQKAQSPYETGRSRMRLASVLAGLGDPGLAKLELSTARKTFERLGALLDMREADTRLDDDTPRTASCTFMFTDIVNSTTLLTSIGDDAWHDVWQWHDRTLRGLVGEHQGRVVKGTGDGLFASFDEPTRAVDCAVAIQRRLDEHRRTEGFSPAVRIGLHMGSAMTFGDDYAGQDVVVAARIGALAAAGEIMVSGDVADHVAPRLTVLGRRTESLKGIPNPVDLVEVEWR